ncbi:MAG: hypothetical protein KDA92_20390, partial [Planctomycetales bacterium]|nr:hypothetical protein [Planctomycetales bacterium]
DLYSWGRIFLHALLGELPSGTQRPSDATLANLPTKLRQFVMDCVALNPARRPRDFSSILKVLEKWQ